MALDERDFFNNQQRDADRQADLSALQARQRLPDALGRADEEGSDAAGADERDRALYAKLRDYMIRIDDTVTCKTCGKKFDIPSQHSMVFIEKGGAAGETYTGGDDEDSRFNR